MKRSRETYNKNTKRVPLYTKTI